MATRDAAAFARVRAVSPALCRASGGRRVTPGQRAVLRRIVGRDMGRRARRVMRAPQDDVFSGNGMPSAIFE